MNLKSILAALLTVSAVSCTEKALAEVKVGAECVDTYVPMLKGKKIALFSNHTGIVSDGRHTLDLLTENGLNVVKIFSPEHGFRGTADAGEVVSSSVDEETGITIVSLYGSHFDYADSLNFADVDAIITDIQDVGLRYYTYYVTMTKLMESAARFDKEFYVFDRPNPNGMYVDGPILDMQYRSGVGRLPIPTVHGLTLGELAIMENEEGWLDDSLKVKSLNVIKCENYDHQTRYELPVAPSPNLKTMHSVYLYPSICYFEATPVSLGRGTESPFEMYGHPEYNDTTCFSFTPESVPGAKNPPQLGNKCYGKDLRGIDDEEIIAKGVDLTYFIDAYQHVENHEKFFYNSFERLMGRGDIRGMIESGMTAEQIKATWAQDVEDFKVLRRKYLLYAE
ncbi:MAG: DUF1343 domain-containing protein [Bacteroidales bacterium]|nr:DUF1343 domain-containing protein [Bacteroidales bacterium]